MPNREARKDIRAFALVLQVVLQYEMGNLSLNEYLARSGKRHFSKNTFDVNFELLVLKQLETMMRENKPRKESLEKFISALEEMGKQLGDTVPLLGLKEIYLWAVAKRDGVPIREVFLEEVRKNFEALEQTEKIKAG